MVGYYTEIYFLEYNVTFIILFVSYNQLINIFLASFNINIKMIWKK